VSERAKIPRNPKPRAYSGFSLIELMISMVILLGVAAIVMSGLLQTSNTEGTVQNRTEMHASVRSATELLQQEIGQAGRVSLPVSPVTLTSAVAAAGTATPSVSSTAGMFVGEFLVVDTGAGYGTTSLSGSAQETVQVSAIAGNTFTAFFQLPHLIGTPVVVHGGFGTGIVPEAANPFKYANGSDGTHLKLYGDINGDGNMVYVEYVCDTAGGNLYRSVSPVDAAAITAKTILLPNILANPGATACFTYQEKPTGCSSTTTACFVTDVAVTLTVQTQQPDASTGQYQQETKALLNVSPRNVFDAYGLSTTGADRVQPIPSTVTALLSQTP
jgi:prepilin-type N-terminal cleavage/methylation domain-containing protein